MRFVNLAEAETEARARLPHDVYCYFAGGAHDELTLAENRRAYDRLALRPRVLVDVGVRDLSTTLLGARVAMPIVIAPMAMQRMAHTDGELATARAAGALGGIMTVSTLATHTLEDIRAATPVPPWFQLYIYKDRGVTHALLERVEAAGYAAVVLTVDTPFLGRRERDVRNAFRAPPGIQVANIVAERQRRELEPVARDSALAAYFHGTHDPTVTWRDLEWLRASTRLPILLKGIVRGDDARLAVEHGARGVVVSNHGGRQLDTAVASIRALPEVADAVGGAIDVLVDGGIRRGTDIVKAIARGARAVMLGRPVLWGLTLGGESGVARVLGLLRDELDLAMALCGCTRLAEITPDLVTDA
jgi:4-hydroxymandelate oxidase